MPPDPIVRSATRGDLVAARTLVEQFEQERGERPMSDQLWSELRDLEAPDARNRAVVLARPAGLDAYAQASREGEHWTLAVVERPEAPLATSQRADLVRSALAEVARTDDRPVHWWVTDPTSDAERTADALGLTGRRRLHRMHRPLPTELPVTVATRPFAVGRDEDEWLAVNARAFARHPEQGAWDRDTLDARIAEPWFDAEGFLLHHRHGRLAAFCWTKVHAGERRGDAIGEIYVIAVDPDFHGLGLGRALTIAGLDHLGRQGISRGMLYVEADNAAAVGMYERLGFTIERTDVAFIGRPPSPAITLPQGDHA